MDVGSGVWPCRKDFVGFWYGRGGVIDGSCAKDDVMGGDGMSPVKDVVVSTVPTEKLEDLLGDGRPSPMPRATIASSRA